MSAGTVTGLVVDVGHLETTVLPVRSSYLSTLVCGESLDSVNEPIGSPRTPDVFENCRDTSRRISAQFPVAFSTPRLWFLCTSPDLFEFDDDPSAHESAEEATYRGTDRRDQDEVLFCRGRGDGR